MVLIQLIVIQIYKVNSDSYKQDKLEELLKLILISISKTKIRMVNVNNL